MAAAVGPEGPFLLGSLRIWIGGASAPPSVAGDGVYEVGDLIINPAPAAAGVPAWSCVTRGAGGTAVFKAWGVLAA